MKGQFVPYKLSVKLHPLGFDEECFAMYDSNGEFIGPIIPRNQSWNDKEYGKGYVMAPLWQQAFDWLFKEFSYICTITNNMTYKQKENILNEAIRDIQNNISE